MHRLPLKTTQRDKFKQPIERKEASWLMERDGGRSGRCERWIACKLRVYIFGVLYWIVYLHVELLFEFTVTNSKVTGCLFESNWYLDASCDTFRLRSLRRNASYRCPANSGHLGWVNTGWWALWVRPQCHHWKRSRTRFWRERSSRRWKRQREKPAWLGKSNGQYFDKPRIAWSRHGKSRSQSSQCKC